MMRGVVTFLEKHHKVRILDEGVDAAVRRSNRYVASRRRPDKAVSVLDTACAKLSLGQKSTPAAIDADQSTRLAKVAAEKAESKEKLDTTNGGQNYPQSETPFVIKDFCPETIAFLRRHHPAAPIVVSPPDAVPKSPLYL